MSPDDATSHVCGKCGTRHESDRCPQCGARAGTRASAWNYLWPILFGLLGGLVAYLTLKDRDPKRAKGVLIWGAVWSALAALIPVALLLGVVSFAGHSSTSNSYSGSSSYATPTPTHTGQRVDSFTPVRSWNWKYTQAGGYSETVEFSIGAPIPADQLPYFSGDQLGSADEYSLEAGDACDLDMSRDAVIPYAIDTTNTTKGFETYIGVKVTSNVDVEAQYSDEVICKTAGESFGGVSRYEVDTGSGPVYNGFLVVPDYYSPQHPDGDASLLEDTTVCAWDVSSDEAGDWDLGTVSGPGVGDCDGGSDNGFTLSGESISDW